MCCEIYVNTNMDVRICICAEETVGSFNDPFIHVYLFLDSSVYFIISIYIRLFTH